MSPPELSVVIPALNEREALPELLDEIETACSSAAATWEVIVVDDGSTDGTYGELAKLAPRHPSLRVLRLRRNFGKSAALAIGFAESLGEVVVTLDGDGQDDPAEISRLLESLDDFDVVSGWKRSRRDPLHRRVFSRIFNSVTSRVAGLRLHDLNCGLKAYRGECIRSIQVYGELHRFIPVLAAQDGWRVTELPVTHRPRRHGRSRFGSERYLRALLDLLTVTFTGRYQHRPLHLFGGLGGALAVGGIAVCLYLAVVWLGGEAIGDRPLLLLGALMILVGVQLLSLGLIAQLVVAFRHELGAPSALATRVERRIPAAIPNRQPDSAPSATGTG